VGGDLRGDGFQNGGALVVGTGGRVLLEFKQEDPTEVVSTDSVLKALGIQVPSET
jgi:prostamide/prostaglandin F2alpha synthase